MTGKWTRMVFFCLFSTTVSSCGAPLPLVSSSLADPSTHEDDAPDETSFFARYSIDSLRIASFDGARLAAKLYAPKTQYFPGPRPTIIFANSWILDENEYDLQARAFANKGYLVLSYATRGFGRSEGVVTVAGPNDLKDVSHLIDWLQDNTDTDVQNLAMAGVSYGGGLALLGAAQDGRIKTAVAISGWADLEQALYGQETVREVWLNLLLGSGSILGRLDLSIFEQVRRLRTNTDIEQVLAWARARSPLAVVDQLNARQVPIFVANSYQDNLFPPAQMRPFFEQLSGPKMFYMDRGIHASSAAPGLFGLPSVIWSEVHRWMDQWLRDIDKGIPAQPPLSFQTERGREFYQEFPALTGKKVDLSLSPLNQVIVTGMNADQAKEAQGQIRIVGGADSGATSGIPLVSEAATGVFDVPVRKKISRIDLERAAVYVSSRLEDDARLRGSPRIQLQLAAHKTPLQLVAYLYDVDRWGSGTLISHGVYSRRTGQEAASRVNLDLGVIAYDLKAGHRLALAIDTRDPLYENPSREPYSLSLIHADGVVPELDLPLLP
jgi:predicted acyl esterase